MQVRPECIEYIHAGLKGGGLLADASEAFLGHLQLERGVQYSTQAVRDLKSFSICGLLEQPECDALALSLFVYRHYH